MGDFRIDISLAIVAPRGPNGAAPTSALARRKAWRGPAQLARPLPVILAICLHAPARLQPAAQWTSGKGRYCWYWTLARINLSRINRLL